jgi:hypothetical protein
VLARELPEGGAVAGIHWFMISSSGFDGKQTSHRRSEPCGAGEQLTGSAAPQGSLRGSRQQSASRGSSGQRSDWTGEHSGPRSTAPDSDSARQLTRCDNLGRQQRSPPLPPQRRSAWNQTVCKVFPAESHPGGSAGRRPVAQRSGSVWNPPRDPAKSLFWRSNRCDCVRIGAHGSARGRGFLPLTPEGVGPCLLVSGSLVASATPA